MILATDEQIVAAFSLVHGEMSGQFLAEVIRDDDCNVIGVACLKCGEEVWRVTLAELTFDLFVLMAHQQREGE